MGDGAPSGRDSVAPVRYWRGNGPTFDVVARSTDGLHILVGETRWRAWGQPIRASVLDPAFHDVDVAATLGIQNRDVVSVLFDAEGRNTGTTTPFHRVDGNTPIMALRS